MANDQAAERRAFSHRTIFVWFAGTIALGFVAAIFIYNRFVTYTPKGVRHIPESAEFVARLNTEQAVVYAPLRRSILPLVERGREGPETRLLHLERKTTVELDVDVRELLFARLDSKTWLLVAAGLLRSEEVLAGTGRMLEDEKIPFARREGLLVHPTGISFGVASDGTMVLGNVEEAVRAALIPASTEPSWARRLQGKGVALGVYAMPKKRSASPPNEEKHSHLLGGTIAVLADSHFPSQGELHLAEGDWTEEQVNSLLHSKVNDFRYLVPLNRFNFLGELDRRNRVRGNLSREEFDQAVMRLAENIGQALTKSLQTPSNP